MGVFQGKDVIPRSDRRATWHDYQGRGLYMLTFRKNGPVEDFCAITDNPVRGQRLNPQIRLSESGEALTRAILRFGHENPALQVLRYMVMPDHLHLLLFVRERLKEPFGSMVARFKGGCSREYWATLPEEEQAVRIPVFSRNYHDRIVTRRGQLQALIDYIRDNPRRYLLKKLLPESVYGIRQSAAAPGTGERDGPCPKPFYPGRGRGAERTLAPLLSQRRGACLPLYQPQGAGRHASTSLPRNTAPAAFR